METAPTTTFGERLGRFVRWFFSASPDEIDELPLFASSRKQQAAASGRRERPSLKARHSGRIEIASKGKR